MQRRRAIALGLSCLVLASLFLTPFAHAVTREDLEAHEARARAAREAAKAAQTAADKLAGEIADLDKTMDQAEADVVALADDIKLATERTQRLQAEVEALRAEIAAREAEIAATEAERDRQQALLATRMETTYKNGDWFYLELVLGSASIEDLIARTSLVTRVLRSNQETALDLKDLGISLAKAKAELDRDLETVSVKRAEAQAEENRLRDLRAQHQAKLDQQKAAQNQKAALMAESKENAARLIAQAEAEEAESARIARELYGSGSGYFAGVMAFPVPGFEQTPTGGSAFGYRIHPILGYRRMHAGIDIGGSAVGRSINGATIVAAGDGTVIHVGYRGGYGETIIIDHGDGVATLYAHLQSGSYKVSNGENVSKGQPIGRVGSTGLSTGPHLHFEVRVNGTPVDPMPYLR